MRYYGEEFMSNYTGAVRSGDKEFQQDMLLDRIAHLISTNPEKIRAALRKSGTDSSVSKKDIIAHTSEQLYINPTFQFEIAKLIHDQNFYHNGIGDIVGAVSGAVQSIAGAFQAKTDKKIEQERTKQQLLDKVFSDQKKTNYIPVIIIGSVLLIGTIVVVYTLRQK